MTKLINKGCGLQADYYNFIHTKLLFTNTHNMYSFMCKHFDIINIHVMTLSNIRGYLSKHKYTENFHIMKKCMTMIYIGYRYINEGIEYRNFSYRVMSKHRYKSDTSLLHLYFDLTAI